MYKPRNTRSITSASKSDNDSRYAPENHLISKLLNNSNDKLKNNDQLENTNAAKNISDKKSHESSENEEINHKTDDIELSKEMSSITSNLITSKILNKNNHKSDKKKLSDSLQSKSFNDFDSEDSIFKSNNTKSKVWSKSNDWLTKYPWIVQTIKNNWSKI